MFGGLVQRAYSGPVRRSARSLGLEGTLASLYYGLVSLAGGETVTVEVGDVSAVFLAPTERVRERIENLATSERPVLEDLSVRLRPNDVVWDVGAHVGLYACLTDSVVEEGRVVAFEPSPARAALLSRNVRLNGADVDVANLALSDGTSTDGLDVGDRPDVAVERGDDLVRTGELPAPDVVKMDVEGGERLALDGMPRALTTCRVLYCEIHPEEVAGSERGLNGEDVRAIDDALRDAGFDVIERIHERDEQPFVRASRESDTGEQ